MISFFNLLELFPAFICASNIGSLVNNIFGVKICYPFPSFTSSSPSSGGMSYKSTDSSLSIFLAASLLPIFIFSIYIPKALFLFVAWDYKIYLTHYKKSLKLYILMLEKDYKKDY